MVSENFNIPLFETHVHTSDKLAEAHSLQLDIFDYCPKCAGTKDYFKIANEIINNLNSR